MDDLLIQRVASFLEAHYSFQKPLLLGYSGGPDSKALLYALIECQKKTPFSLHVAHVDHGWREESFQEAGELQKEIAELGYPFHLQRLQLESKKNIEAVSRNHRLSFFQKILQEIQGEALLLAHQKDDVAETVLKRILEGAHLPHIFGLKPKSHLKEIPIFRPLLTVAKEEIYQFLKRKELTPIEDRTNLSEKFLRGKMRTQIIPNLSQSFGKKVSENLYEASLRSQELNDYLDERIKPFLESLRVGPLGKWLLFPENMPTLEAKHLLLHFLGFTPGRKELEDLLLAIKEKTPNRVKYLAKKHLFLDRGAVFFVPELKFGFEGSFPLKKEGAFQWGKWKVSIEKVKKMEKQQLMNWQNFFQGKMEFFLPPGNYHLALPKKGEKYRTSELRKWWNNQEVPAFFRDKFPILYRENEVFQELLSGRKKNPSSEEACLQINLEYFN